MNGVPVRAIAIIVFGLAAAALSGGLMKMLSETLPPVLVVWFRFAGYFLMMLPIVLWRSGLRVLQVPRPGMQLVRGFCMAGSTIFFLSGARTLDYADAIAILYAYPFFLTLLAPFLLGERVSLAAWFGVTGGFIGVLLVVRPSFAGVGVDALMVLACALLVTSQLIINRKLGAVADPLAISCYGAAVATVVTSVSLPWVWQPVPVSDWGLVVASCVAGAVSQTMIVVAFSRTAASDLAPFTYTELISAVIFGWLLFGTLPDWISWVGIALICASGVAVARAMAMRNMPRRVPRI